MNPLKSIFRLLTCLLIVFSCTSCVTSLIVASQKKQANNINKTSVRLSGKTVQLINRHSALVVTDKSDVVCVIYDFDEYYDGLKIKGRFRRYGTYEFLFSDGTIHYAPIFVREKDFRKYMIIAKELGATKVDSREKKSEVPRSEI